MAWKDVFGLEADADVDEGDAGEEATLTKEEKKAAARDSAGKKIKLGYFKDQKDKYLNAASGVFNVLSGAVIPFFIYYFFRFIAVVLDQGNWAVELIPLIFIAIADFALSGCGTFIPEWAAERQLKKMRERFLKSILSQDMSYFDAFDATALASQLNGHCGDFRDVRGYKSGLYFTYMGVTCACFGIAVYESWILGLISFAVLPLAVFGAFWSMRAEILALKRSRKALEGASFTAHESVSAIRTVKAFGLEGEMRKRFHEACDRAKAVTQLGVFKVACFTGLYWFIIFVCVSIAFYVAAQLLARAKRDGTDGCTETFEPCELQFQGMSNFLYTGFAAYFIGKILPMYTNRTKAKKAVVAIVKLCDRPTETDPFSTEGYSASSSTDARIEFSHVAFNYPSRPESMVFSDLNLTIGTGQTVALVGGSGCGKSTCVQLLERFYAPVSGNILLNGTPLSAYNLTSLRDQIALVSQEPRLFALTVAENILVGKSTATKEEVIQAAKESNAHDFIMQLPKGYDTWVGEGGGQLSGGQKQRIAIARAILRNPRILILDEATSALDNQSEKLVQQTLEKVVAGGKRTTLIIAHRLTTIRNADKIVVLDNSSGMGSVVAEQGTHDELLKVPNGLYAALVRSQLGTDAPADETAELDVNDSTLQAAHIAKKFTRELSKRQASLVSLRSKFSIIENRAPVSHQSRILECDEELLGEIQERGVFKRTMKPTLNDRLYCLVVGALAATASGVVWPMFAWVLAKITLVMINPLADVVISEANKWIAAPLILGLCAALATFLVAVMFGASGCHTVTVLQKETFNSVIVQEGGFFDHPGNSPGTLVHLLCSEITQISGWVGENLGVIASSGASVIVACAFAFNADWKIGLVALACLLILIPLTFIAGRITSTGGKLKRDDPTKAAANEKDQTPERLLNEVILNIRTVSAYNMQRDMFALFQQIVHREFLAGKKRAFYAGMMNGLSHCLRLLTITGVIYLSVKVLMDKWIEEADDATDQAQVESIFVPILQAIGAVVFASLQTGRSLMGATSNSRAHNCAQNLFRLLDRRPLIDETSLEGAQLARLDQIQFDRVRFRYPTRPDILVYKDVSFKIPQGSTVALVGASGCGKSTAVQLLERFYDVADDSLGGLLINGKDIREYNVHSVRSTIGFVQQEPVLFWGTVEENLSLARPGATMEEIQAACTKANAHSFIMQLPNGYQTDVGRGGSRLSGGQKQRVAIARALLRNPQLMILDEATSALDNESERIVQQALNELIASKSFTTLVIAHRLSTIKTADIIIVFANPDNGGSRIAEVGSHEELMKVKDGIYAGLVRIAAAN